MIQVEQVIEKQFPQLIASPLLYKSSSKLLKNLMHEDEFQQFEKDYPHLSGLDFVEQVLDYFDISYSVRDSERLHIPSSGRLVIIANHPIGSLDALALIKLISEVRSDIKVMANQLLYSLAPLQELLVPVDNIKGTTSKITVNSMKQHLSNDGVLLIFPAGEVSRLRPQGVRDTFWQKGFLKIAKAYKAPILPMHIDAKNSPMFYSLSMLYKPLASFLLIEEMFKQRKRNFPIRIGALIPLSSFEFSNTSSEQQVKLFKKHVYAIGEGKKGYFDTQTGIALPENKANLSRLLKEKCELLGETQDGKHIYLYEHVESCVIMREIGRLREIAFRAVGEGTNRKRDVDKYDSDYLHLILWDKDELEIVGAYRFGRADVLTTNTKTSGLYSATLVKYEKEMAPYFAKGLELGRSFVQPKYWGKRSLDYLWYGIGAYLKHYPEIRYLFGPVSMSGTMPTAVKDEMVAFYLNYFGSQEKLASANNPYRFYDNDKSEFQKSDYKTDFKALKASLANQGAAIPTLFKQYTELCEEGGVKFLCFGVDPDFNNSVDGLVLVDLAKLKDNKRKRYLA